MGCMKHSCAPLHPKHRPRQEGERPAVPALRRSVLDSPTGNPSSVFGHLPEGGDLGEGGATGRRRAAERWLQTGGSRERLRKSFCCVLSSGHFCVLSQQPAAAGAGTRAAETQGRKFPVSPYRRLRWEVSLIASVRKMEHLISVVPLKPRPSSAWFKEKASSH